MRVLMIDNYDSFTWNLVHYLTALDADVTVARNDAIEARTAVSAAVAGTDAVVISPGPGDPDGAGVSLGIVMACAAAGRPLLGVCLGHQAIAQAFGGRIMRADKVMHGKTSPVTHDGTGVFADVPSPFDATRYHSLVIAPDAVPEALRVTARGDDGAIMGIAHCDLPIHGVQFHPESVATAHGHLLLANFLRLALRVEQRA